MNMPHVIVKLWPGKPEAKKAQLAEKIVRDVMEVFNYGEESVSVSMEEVKSSDWAEKVYEPDIRANWDKLYKKPGYAM
jgi:4-oxalocrotonate tautomerase